MTKTITCTNCKGSGQLPCKSVLEETITCTTCNGTGTIEISLERV